MMLSPALGTSSSPSTETAIDGPAALTALPLSSNMARTRPIVVPERILSPVCSVPFCTMMFATGPLPLSSLASMMVPFA